MVASHSSALTARDYAPLLDYLSDGYGVRRDDVQITQGGKHAKMVFPWEGKNIVTTLPRVPNNPDTWLNLKLQDIRRMLGEPKVTNFVYDRPRRTLEEMTNEIKVMQSHVPVVDSTLGIEMGPEPKRWDATVALRQYGSGTTVEISLPAPLAQEFCGDAWPSFAVDYVHGKDGLGLFTIRRVPASSPRPLKEGARYTFKCGASAIRDRIGAFYGTPAEAWMEGPRILVQLTEPPRKARVVASKIEKVEIFQEVPVEATPVASVEDRGDPSTITFIPDRAPEPKVEASSAPIYSVAHGDLSVAVSLGEDGGLKIMANTPRGGLGRLARVLGKIEETMRAVEGGDA